MLEYQVKNLGSNIVHVVTLHLRKRKFILFAVENWTQCGVRLVAGLRYRPNRQSAKLLAAFRGDNVWLHALCVNRSWTG